MKTNRTIVRREFRTLLHAVPQGQLPDTSRLGRLLCDAQESSDKRSLVAVRSNDWISVDKPIILEEGIKALSPLLAHSDWRVRDSAGVWLSQLDHPLATHALAVHLKRHPENPFEHAYVDILAYLSEHPTDELIPAFVKESDSGFRYLMTPAMTGLINLKTPKAMRALEHIAARGKWDPDVAFRDAMDRQHPPNPENLAVLVRYAKAHQDPAYAHFTLGRIHVWLAHFARSPQTADHPHVQTLLAMDAHLRANPKPLGEGDALLEHPTVAAKAYHAALYPPRGKPFSATKQRALFVQQLREQLDTNRFK